MAEATKRVCRALEGSTTAVREAQLRLGLELRRKFRERHVIHWIVACGCQKAVGAERIVLSGIDGRCGAQGARGVKCDLACRRHTSNRRIDIDGPTPPHGNVLAPRVHNKAAQKTKRQNNTTYSGFGGALAYGYGFRIGSAPFGIVAVFGAQNSFCHAGVR